MKRPADNWIGSVMLFGGLLVAAGLGYLGARAGLWVLLQAIGSLALPLLLMTAMAQANKRRPGSWLTLVLTFALLALAAWGMWNIIGYTTGRV